MTVSSAARRARRGSKSNANSAAACPTISTSELRAELYRSFDEQAWRPFPALRRRWTDISQPVCVASSGSPERIRTSLTLVGLYDRFAPNMFSALQVENGKPAPDLFLFAAAQMQVPPARCLVVEDSVPGVIAARAAGMAVLGFHGGSHCRPATAAALRDAGATSDVRRHAAIAGPDRRGSRTDPVPAGLA